MSDVVREFCQLHSSKKRRGFVFQMALIHAAMQEKEEALVWLENAYSERSAWTVFLKVDPRLDNLWSEPCFQDLLRSMNFPT